MKTTILQMISLTLLLSAFTVTAQGQQVFHVGDAVEVQDGSNWIPGRIESVENNIAKVRIGKGKYDFINIQLPTTRFRVPGSAAREARDVELRNTFRQDAGKYLQTVKKFAPFYDEKYIPGGAPLSSPVFEEIRRSADAGASFEGPNRGRAAIRSARRMRKRLWPMSIPYGRRTICHLTDCRANP